MDTHASQTGALTYMLPSLLLVDDDPKLVQLMGRLLGDLGRIRFATSGEAALRQANAERPDLILLDAEMPGMNGFDTCAALKATPELSDVPVIFVTSHTDLDHEVLGFSVQRTSSTSRSANPSCARGSAPSCGSSSCRTNCGAWPAPTC
jgi:CheY-like chemotaxis protein